MDTNIINNPLIIKNVFTTEQLQNLYLEINNIISNDYLIQQTLGRLYSIIYWKEDKKNNGGPVGLKISKNFVDTINSFLNKNLNVDLELESISYTKYSLNYGLPNLSPHVDTNFIQPRVTFDIQLDSNISWPILIEEKEYILENNQALVFSGTHQVHWRKKINFNENEYVDMLLCQFSEKNNNLIDSDIIKTRTIRQKILNIKYDKGII